MSFLSLNDHLSDAGAHWLEAALADVRETPTATARHFPAASRRCGRAPLHAEDPLGLTHGTIDDAVRARLLSSITLGGAELVDLLDDLYRHGDAGEKRGVLRALHLLEGLGDDLLPLVEDALRTNDVRLVAGALQPYGARVLGADAYRHAVVKCVFTGVPLHVIGNLCQRQDPELARMLVDLAHERAAAGREIPADIHAVIAAFPECLDRSDLSAALVSALQSAPAPNRTAPQ